MIELTLAYRPDPQTYFVCLHDLPQCVWLDSGKPNSDRGRFDIFSAAPSRTLQELTRDNLHCLLQQLQQHACEHDLPFCGGWLGYFSYPCLHARLQVPNHKPYPGPEIGFGWYDWALVIDHQDQSARLVFQPQCDPSLRQLVQARLAGDLAPGLGTYQCGPFRAELSREEYQSALLRIHEYLLAGDCYQVNFAQRFCAEFAGSAAAAYAVLRRAVPSPYSAFMPRPDGAILSISPERFIGIRGDRAITEPIKGTAPRGQNNRDDQLLQAQLQASSKNRAENLMIVDLLRNDFSRNCQPHSVKVPELFGLQSFANVHHLVSTVTGTLNPGVSHLDFILDCFPGGSITGAPKKRAMEIIEELEPWSRGIYCGAIGYFSCNGNSDFNIAIRTLEQIGQRIYAWGGGGIVVDSDADQEYQESLNKIDRLLQAVSNRVD